LILRALQATGWVVGGPAGAAAQLGLKRTTLIAKMKKLGISRPRRQDEMDWFGEEEISSGGSEQKYENPAAVQQRGPG